MKRIVQWGLLLIITGSTLAFGAVRPPAYSAVEAALFLLSAVLLIKQTSEGKINLPVPLWVLPFLGLVLIQAIPLP